MSVIKPLNFGFIVHIPPDTYIHSYLGNINFDAA